ncbi:MAG TPA: YggS family pyridoxal phosphate-dependent enzyme [Kofleriaceae bacterium]|nr:YggS family pyridoxal phosphate-dependent enzyme [Kofleriaceae bacterium]
MTIAERWAEVNARVAAACERAGRLASEVTIIAVSKTHPVSAIREALAAGATDFGENYAQELAAKQAELAATDAGSATLTHTALTHTALRWHYIGRLQRNKARLVAGRVALVHAVDSVELAEELARRAGAAGQPILLAVNLAGEATKGGVTAATAPDLARALAGVPGVSLDGLMTMPPPADDAAASRPYFAGLRALRDRLADELGRPLPVLSMGMSDDFEVAIACGATHVRIGTAIFGARG